MANNLIIEGENLKMKKLVIVILFGFCVIACGKKNQEIKNGSKKNSVQSAELRAKTTEDEIKEMVNIWNEASSNADFGTLEKILADKIEYYQTIVSRDYYIKDQKKFLEKNPVYGQVLKGDIKVEKISNRQVKAEFVKEVTTKKGIKDYPSYLVFEKINGEWKIVLESDLVSDENIRKQKIAKTKSISSSEEAYQLVRKSIIKHDLVDVNCIMTLDSGRDENYYYFDIRSDNEKCGGDPGVAPRLFSYQVNKKTGELKTDSMDWAEKIGKDPGLMEFHAID